MTLLLAALVFAVSAIAGYIYGRHGGFFAWWGSIAGVTAIGGILFVAILLGNAASAATGRNIAGLVVGCAIVLVGFGVVCLVGQYGVNRWVKSKDSDEMR